MRLGTDGGFSLLEVTIVLVVIGVLALLAFPRITTTETFAQASYADQVATALRYAQRYAVATGCDVEVDVSASSDPDRFSLKRRNSGGSDTSCAAAPAAFSVDLNQPGQATAYSVNAPDGVAIASDLAIVFDAQGIPSVGGVFGTGGSISVGGRVITVESGTGYVH